MPARPQEDLAAPEAGRPQELGSVLDGLLAGGPWRSGVALGELGRRWGEVVGEPLASETAPARLDAAGVLTVRASTSGWAAQLRFLAGQIRDNANEMLGVDAVREVRIGIDPSLAQDT